MKSPEERLIELLSDETWRLNNLYWIVNKDGDIEKFHMNWAQRHFHENMHNRNVIVKARQLGLSTLVALKQFDRAIWNPNQSCGIVDRTDKMAIAKLDKMRFAWENLDRIDEDMENQDLARLIAEMGAKLKKKRGVQSSKGGAYWPELNSRMEIGFSNGSCIWGGTSFRGGTVQLLHISELGKTAVEMPDRAEEVRRGSLNAVGTKGIIISESTHEGGRQGVHYDLIEPALANIGKENLDNKEWKFFFYPWHQQPEYVADPGLVKIPSHLEDYFQHLRVDHGIDLSPERRAFYALTYQEQRDAILTEYPSHVDEALDVPVTGAIYGPQLSTLQLEGRLCKITPEPTSPLWAFIDIGWSDETAVWLVQPIARRFCFLRWYAWHEQPFEHFWAKIKEWERELGLVLDRMFLPHDASQTSRATGVSYVGEVSKLFPSRRITVLPKPHDVFIGINHARRMLARCEFDLSTNESFKVGTTNYTGGFTRLLSYRQKVETDGSVISAKPVHDLNSHTADAFRLVAEAEQQNELSKWNTPSNGNPRVSHASGVGFRQASRQSRTRTGGRVPRLRR